MFPLEEILAAFPRRKALVIGDVCLDRWCVYDPAASEPSRETGIPRTAVVRVGVTPGAGGTIANNLAALQIGQVSVLAALGDDGHGWELRRALSLRGIQHDLCVTHPDICTFTYTKLLNAATGEEDLPRVDFINSRSLPAAIEQDIIQQAVHAVPNFDVIFISDQAETETGGVVTPKVRDVLSELARQYPEKVFWVDSRLRPERFRGMIVKPNEEEAKAACDRLSIPQQFQLLQEAAEAPLLLVTHGPKGVLIFQDGRQSWVPTLPIQNPVDICGAGDSFSAGAAVAYSAMRNAATAAAFGNLVASITIMKKGTGDATPAELRHAYAGQPR